MKYYNFIKKKREELKYSTRKLGEKINVSGSYISMIENNKIPKIPSKEVLEKLCVALKLTKEEIEEFYNLVYANNLPEKIQIKIKKLENKVEILEKENDNLNLNLNKEFSNLSEKDKIKVLKFIEEFIKK